MQLVTSAVRPIPQEWKSIPSLHLVVSIDGLAPEHDLRRTPATYDRILKHIAAHRITVHCTVTRPMLARPGYLADFCRFWSDRPEVGQNLVQHLYATGGRSIAGTLAAGGPRNPLRRIVHYYAVSEGAFAADGTRWLSQSAALARGMYVRAPYHHPFGRPEDARHAMPAGRQAGLRGMWLSRLGWNARAGKPETWRACAGLRDLELIDAAGRPRRASVVLSSVQCVTSARWLPLLLQRNHFHRHRLPDRSDVTVHQLSQRHLITACFHRTGPNRTSPRPPLPPAVPPRPPRPPAAAPSCSPPSAAGRAGGAVSRRSQGVRCSPAFDRRVELPDLPARRIGDRQHHLPSRRVRTSSRR